MLKSEWETHFEQLDCWILTLIETLFRSIEYFCNACASNPGDIIDPREHLGIKALSRDGPISAEFFYGIAFSKLIEHKKMSRKLTNPVLAIITFPLDDIPTMACNTCKPNSELNRTGQLFSLDELVSQQKPFHLKLTETLQTLGVTLIFTTHAIPHSLTEHLASAGITAVASLKLNIVDKVRTAVPDCCVFTSFKDLSTTDTDPATNSALLAKFECRTIPSVNPFEKRTVCLLETKPGRNMTASKRSLPLTLLIMGPNSDAELKCLKRALRDTFLFTYHVVLLRSLLESSYVDSFDLDCMDTVPKLHTTYPTATFGLGPPELEVAKKPSILSLAPNHLVPSSSSVPSSIAPSTTLDSSKWLFSKFPAKIAYEELCRDASLDAPWCYLLQFCCRYSKTRQCGVPLLCYLSPYNKAADNTLYSVIKSLSDSSDLQQTAANTLLALPNGSSLVTSEPEKNTPLSAGSNAISESADFSVRSHLMDPPAANSEHWGASLHAGSTGGASIRLLDLIQSFSHNDGRVDLQVFQIGADDKVLNAFPDQPVLQVPFAHASLERDDVIVWGSCRKCKATRAPVSMPLLLKQASFAIFLELFFHARYLPFGSRLCIHHPFRDYRIFFKVNDARQVERRVEKLKKKLNPVTSLASTDRRSTFSYPFGTLNPFSGIWSPTSQESDSYSNGSDTSLAAPLDELERTPPSPHRNVSYRRSKLTPKAEYQRCSNLVVFSFEPIASFDLLCPQLSFKAVANKGTVFSDGRGESPFSLLPSPLYKEATLPSIYNECGSPAHSWASIVQDTEREGSGFFESLVSTSHLHFDTNHRIGTLSSPKILPRVVATDAPSNLECTGEGSLVGLLDADLLHLSAPAYAEDTSFNTLTGVYSFSSTDAASVSLRKVPISDPDSDTTRMVRDDEPSSVIAFVLNSLAYAALCQSQGTAVGLPTGRDDNVVITNLSNQFNVKNILSLLTPGNAASESSVANPIVKAEHLDNARGSVQKPGEPYNRKSSQPPSDPHDRTAPNIAANLTAQGDGSEDLVEQHPIFEFSYLDLRCTCRVYFWRQFEDLRRSVDVDLASFIGSLSRCAKFEASGGKSKSLFLRTHDGRFLLKSLTKTQLSAFLCTGPSYFDYLQTKGSFSLLAKTIGVFSVTAKRKIAKLMPSAAGQYQTEKFDLVVMENLFYKRQADVVFDLKGSRRNRLVKQPKEGDVLLDENWLDYISRQPVFLTVNDKKLLRVAVSNDCQYLATRNIMDYSLIVGVSYVQRCLYVGVVDYFQTFSFEKKIESWVKESGILGGNTNEAPTVISPKQYKSRFLQSIEKSFHLLPD